MNPHHMDEDAIKGIGYACPGQEGASQGSGSQCGAFPKQPFQAFQPPEPQGE